ncbi:M20 family metallo-hydrolase [Flavobacteriaceae bacterium]|uniref:M20 family metallo-hydrolase n=1 Tax=Candidatus Arcticimaribacter forsetii TaxID=2820661 RepID=UPI002076F112|nr:M20 family metallo-hydrolase [Candidatus Arcticimaribacter forsetii]MDA8698978.1 M20 family metallo-hydrolase [Flavobacteriaceae bacterium]MDB2329376.1 M20 family metallo-hydrolase [Flavobacteriaceae bacterium]MDB2345600.1 M20 family metallo-hydrolase [Flavobacteriaceae bacterium]MDB4621087.1 M20 family metallo-hydrolase [Flavobacteriaceae bacterium]MDB4716788.1 M20 family metallo-hydrolase [Flavobacteriaceae bacterium]
MNEVLTQEALALLKDLISIQSFSSEEQGTAERIEKWFTDHDIPFMRENNNVYAFNHTFEEGKPTLLLNSHHDTVKPNSAYTKDPFQPHVEDGKLYGLGSNDAGGPLVSLIALFTHYYEHPNPKYNLIIAATAEEESSGPLGLNSLLKTLPPIDVAIVGEPTLMQLAVAEKGLVVFDGVISGTASHAAHPNDDNPIMKLPGVLQWFNDFEFEKVSDQLGPVKMTVTQVSAGKQHNVVPAEVNLVIDVRVNDRYTNQEIVDLLQKEAPCKLTPRSIDLNSSSIPLDHELVTTGIELGRKPYGSPTLSDQAKLSCPSLKLGPGDSTRSHTANEYIHVSEIEEGISIYINLLNEIL